MASVPEQLYQWRHKYRLNQAEAAALADVSLTTYSRWERGVTTPSGKKWRELQDLMRRDRVPGHLGRLLGDAL
jgi:transcriptional regulator with XRE-family HTH domain